MIDLIQGLFCGFKELIDYFLDTTPRTHIQKIRQSVFSIFCIGNRGIAVFLASSILLHFMLVLPSMPFFRDLTHSLGGSALESDPSEEQKISELIADNEAIEVTGIFYVNGTEKLKRAKPALSPTLSHLLAKLNRQSKSWNMGTSIPASTAQATITQKTDTHQDTDWMKKSEEKTKQAQVKSFSSSLEKNLSRYIAKYNPQFQNCYENALLKDPTIVGKIAFDLKIGGNGKIEDTKLNFDGQGTKSSLEFLDECLKAVTNRIQLTPTMPDLIGKQIQFYVMLKAN